MRFLPKIKALALALGLLCALSVEADAKGLSRAGGGPGPSGSPPVITFNAPSAGYIYPAASGTVLDTVTATVSPGSFLPGGGNFTSSNCAASNMTVASGGAVTVTSSTLSGNQSCTITANYPGATSVAQTFTLTGTRQTILSISSGGGCSLGSGCSYTFTTPATGAILDTVPTVTMSGGISFSAGGGTIVLGSGSQCSDYALSGGNLQITAASPGTFACSYTIADSNASNSPQTPTISAVGGTNPTTNVVSIQVDDQNVPTASSIGFQIGTLSAKVTGGGACTTCSWTVTRTGVPSGQGGPLCRTQSPGPIQVINNGDGTASLQVATAGLTRQVFGTVPFSSSGLPCVTATPAVGTPLTWGISIFVRDPVINAVAPRFVAYTPGVAGSVNFSASICWGASTNTTGGNCHQAGAAPTPTYTLSGDAACTGLSITGAALSWTTGYTGNGVCHVTVAAAGVTCPSLASLAAMPTTCSIPVRIKPTGTYAGPGDAVTGMTWFAWTYPYAFSAAYAAPGTNPIWTVVKESDSAGTYFTANAMPNGDMDLIGLANACGNTMCYFSNSPASPGPVIAAASDQSGHSPANDLGAWADHADTYPAITIHRPMLVFNAVAGMPMPTADNGTDKFLQNSTTYTGTGATGTILSVSEIPQYALNIGQAQVNLNGTTTPVLYLQYECTNTASCGGTGSGIGLYIGTNAGANSGPNIVCTAPAQGVFHSAIAAIGGTGTNQSDLYVDGVSTLGTTPNAASLEVPVGNGGGPGGGSIAFGYIGGYAHASTVANLTQLGQLFGWDSDVFGIPTGSC